MRVAHWLGPLTSDGVPARHVILDTEADLHSTPTGQSQTFSLAVADYCAFHPKRGLTGSDTRPYSDPRELWADIAAYTRNRHRTIVWAHNLAYDLRVAQALVQLPALGLQLGGIVLGQGSSWAVFRGEHRTVLCCDLASWLPTSLASIARDLALQLAPLPLGEGSPQQLLDRCQGDVAVTRVAVSQLLQLLAQHQLGPWRATGAGQSHAAWRRRFLTHPPLVHDDSVVLDAERRAMWTGRCEAWRHGTINRGGVHEYDLRLAYPHIAASCDVPAKLIGETSATHGWQVIGAMATRAVLAEVDVTTELELAPTEHGNLIHWPVGTFTTTLWDPELRLLYERGAKVKVRRCWLYERAPVLGAFSRWLLDSLGGDDPELLPVQRRALKHMARTVIGRCALRYRSWEPLATVPESNLHLGELHDLATGETVELLHVGTELMTLADQVDAEDSLPQITGWVMSEARARLWRLIEIAGPEHVHYLDTDSLIVDDAGARVLDALIDAGAGEGLAHKGSYQRAVILGPRQLQLGRYRRLAGIPLSAVQTSPGVYEGQVWRSIRESVARGEGTRVVLERKRWELAGVDNRRTHLPGGATAPHRVG